jgi:hypothetical protein
MARATLRSADRSRSAHVAAQDGDRGAPQARQIALEHRDPAAVRDLRGIEQLEQRALARARGAGDQHHLAGIDGEIDLL